MACCEIEIETKIGSEFVLGPGNFRTCPIWVPGFESLLEHHLMSLIEVGRDPRLMKCCQRLRSMLAK